MHEPTEVTRFKCVVCGKLTVGRLPRAPWEPGDGSERFPRRHKVDGVKCPGSVMLADWVDVAAETGSAQ